MLIPIEKTSKETVYKECQHLKDVYKDETVVGVYATSFLDGHWLYCLAKTVIKDNCVETVDSCIVHDEGNTDWAEVNKRFCEFLSDVECVINYGDRCVFKGDGYNIENLDLEVMAMYCQYYFRYRGLNTLDIEYARCTFEYGECVEGIDMYAELTNLIGNILCKYEALLKQDEEKNKSE